MQGPVWYIAPPGRRISSPAVHFSHLAKAAHKRPERSKNMASKNNEHTCPGCKGTGLPVVAQPVQPGHKIGPLKCKACGGKGKITDADRGGSWPSYRPLPPEHSWSSATADQFGHGPSERDGDRKGSRYG